MCVADTRKRRKRLGEILVDAAVLTEEQLQTALAQQAAGGRRERLGKMVVKLGFVTEEDVTISLADQLGYSTVDLIEETAEPAALSRVPRKLAERHQALPLRVEGNDVLVVAMADPTNVVALDDIRLTSGMRAVRPVVATSTALEDALNRLYGSDSAALEMVEGLNDGDVSVIEEDDEDLASIAEGAGEQPVVRLANAILADAVRSRTSDVHVEPERDSVRVRYRIDGLLREKMRIPKHIGPALISRFKIMSQLDIAERRLPQDGRAAVRIEGQEVDLRVSSMPGMHGEVIVMRLLRKGTQRLGIDEIGMAEDSLETFRLALSRPQGLIIITGPTGSGKTSTLYAGLTEITDEVRNIITLEDPIEYELGGINQTQIRPKIGFTFARGMRTVLRQDPDVVMVGEIRDQETAELGMEASFTGHLVLSTLHTNDAPSSVIRLVDLGVERFMIASSLVLVIAQRLVRVVCPHCKTEDDPSDKVMRLLGLSRDDIKGATLMRGAGCNVCEKSGFLGRTAVYEMLSVTPRLREMIIEGATETKIAKQAREDGMRTLREDALVKALNGLTTLAEVLRVTPDAELDLDAIQRAAVGDFSVPEPEVPLDIGLSDLEEGDEAPLAPDLEPTGDATVLVVDDDASIRELLGVLLMDDYVVLEAADGEDALALAKKNRPDAVILDFKLPDRDGIEVTRELRAAANTRDAAIIMITGVEDPSTEVEGLLAGVDDYITKPFDEDVLKMRLSAAVKRNRRR